ncbi:MAG: S-layer homology domain-containing protein [Ruminococcaceae bacterium]|nr:S-layer homology domain-containing protein [Oscillospiraceae bacterium]
MYKSSDCAKTWEKLCGAIDSAQRIVPDSEIMDRLYVGSFKKGFAIVDDGVITYKGIADGLSYGDNEALSYYEIAQNPNNPNHLVTCGHGGAKTSRGSGVHESFDRGETWNYVCELPGSVDSYRVRYHLDGKRVFITTSNGTFVYMPEKYKQYKDIIYSDIENSFAKEKIEALYEDGILNKYHNGLFKPDAKVYRWEFAKAVNNALDLNSVSYKQIYSDIEQISKHYFYTAALCENGVLDVSEGEEFRPYTFLKYSEIKDMAENIRIKLNKDEVDLDSLNLNLSDDSVVTREQTAYILYHILND